MNISKLLTRRGYGLAATAAAGGPSGAIVNVGALVSAAAPGTGGPPVRGIATIRNCKKSMLIFHGGAGSGTGAGANGHAHRFYGGGKKSAAFVPPTYDELPVPSGSWAAAAKATNRKRSKHLFFGLASILFTLFFIYRSEKLFFNAYPPKLPSEELEDACKPKDDTC